MAALIAASSAIPLNDEILPEDNELISVDNSVGDQTTTDSLLEVAQDYRQKLQGLVAKHPELKMNKQLQALDADNVDEAGLATTICKNMPDDTEIQKMCGEYITGHVDYDHLVKTGMNKRDTMTMTEEDKNAQSTSCASWSSSSLLQLKSSDKAGSLQASEILDAASPYMECLCTVGNGPSYCGTHYSPALVSTMQRFEEAIITTAGDDLTKGLQNGQLLENPRKSRIEMMTHPALAELIQHFMTENGETTPSGRRKNLFDHIVEKAGGTAELAQSKLGNQVCRDIARMTSFDPARVAASMKGTLTASTGGTFSCSGGCDVGGSVSIACDAFGVAQAELGWDFNARQLFLKFKMCVPVLSDILDILSDIPAIKSFLTSRGIDGGCLLLGQGTLTPGFGVAEMMVDLPHRVLTFVLRFFAKASIVWNRNVGDTRMIQCLSWLYSNRNGMIGMLYEMLDYLKCQHHQIGVRNWNWAVGVYADISINFDVWAYSKRLGGFEADLIF